APEGLWQIIRIFTGFYNIPVITLVLVGLFTRRVPALAARVVVVFHVVAYGLLQFVWPVEMNFIHLYAVLFVIEVILMLLIGWWRPLAQPWRYQPKPRVNLTPWRHAGATAVLLVACIALTYLLFSPLGVAGEPGLPLALAVLLVVAVAGTGCWWCDQRWRRLHAGRLPDQ
ncbi:MAG: solute:sodium symporter family transporter, partial [Pseudomonadota bacterium]